MSQPGVFPLTLEDGDLKWKVLLNYDLFKEIFLLNINGISFSDMPVQAEVNPEGPQNILNGSITLNGVVVHDGWAQFDHYTVYDWYTKIDKEPGTDIQIGYGNGGFMCTSAEVLNTMLD